MKNYQNLNVSELTELIKKHNHLYWDLNAPEISDYDYDILTKTLIKLDPNAEILNHLGPTFSEIGVEVKHNYPMLSFISKFSRINVILLRQSTRYSRNCKPIV